jgi:microcystin-dependent protein
VVAGAALKAGWGEAGAGSGASSAEKAAVTSERVSRVVTAVSFMDVLSVLRDVVSAATGVWTGVAMVAGEGRPVNRPLYITRIIMKHSLHCLQLTRSAAICNNKRNFCVFSPKHWQKPFRRVIPLPALLPVVKEGRMFMFTTLHRITVAAVLLAAPLVAVTPAHADDPYIGEIRWVAFNFAPAGWALCDGQILPISQNQALFALLGTTYGGDGQTTFALPDMRGRVPLHSGQGVGLSPRTIGDHGGQETHTISLAEMPVHSHQPRALTATGSTPSPTGGYWAGSSGKNNLYSSFAPDTVMAPQQVPPQGGGRPYTLMMPYQVLTCIVSLYGIFPSQ